MNNAEDLNSTEVIVLMAMYKECMRCTRGEFGFTDDVHKNQLKETMSAKSYSSYVGHLQRKRYITIDPEYNQFQFTEKFKDTYPVLAEHVVIRKSWKM